MHTLWIGTRLSLMSTGEVSYEKFYEFFEKLTLLGHFTHFEFMCGELGFEYKDVVLELR